MSEPAIAGPGAPPAAPSTPRTNSSSATSTPAAARNSPTSTTTALHVRRSRPAGRPRGRGAVGLGIAREQRVLVALYDTIDFPSVFLGAIKAGIVPVAVNTLLTTSDYDYMLRDSRASALVVSEGLVPAFAPLLEALPDLRHVLVSGSDAHGHTSLAGLIGRSADRFDAVATSPDEACFWLYSSGSTGAPKGTVHIHSSMDATAELYGKPVLGIQEADVVFSAAKLPFAYGLGNASDLSAGGWGDDRADGRAADPGRGVQAASRAPADNFLRRSDACTRRCSPRPTCRTRRTESAALRFGRRSAARRTGQQVDRAVRRRHSRRHRLDRDAAHLPVEPAGDVKYGTTGKPVPGYDIRLTDDAGNPWPGRDRRPVDRGPSAAKEYWNQREKTRATFQGWWTRSGDKYSVDADGYYVYAGRSDDMLKVGGFYVSPSKSSRRCHASLGARGRVVGHDDERAVQAEGVRRAEAGLHRIARLADDLQSHVKTRLAPYKYPRWIEFIDELPKTATGKIQRFKLRTRSSR
jgi:benzoate-CoA ligase